MCKTLINLCLTHVCLAKIKSIDLNLRFVFNCGCKKESTQTFNNKCYLQTHQKREKKKNITKIAQDKH